MKPLAYQQPDWNHKANFRDLSQFDAKLKEQETWADFWETKIWKIAAAKNARFYWTRYFAKNWNPNFQDSKRQCERQLDFIKRLKDLTKQTPNGLRYLRWGGDGEAVQPEKW